MRKNIYITKNIKVILLCIFMINLYSNNINAIQTSGVLVVSEDSHIHKISIIEVRKLFLGLPASKKSGIHKPVINYSDKQVYNIFLKKILRMTDKVYKRKIIKRVFRLGSENIKFVDKKEQLIKYLRDNPNDVSFMLLEDVKGIKGIKVIQELW